MRTLFPRSGLLAFVTVGCSTEREPLPSVAGDPWMDEVSARIRDAAHSFEADSRRYLPSTRSLAPACQGATIPRATASPGWSTPTPA